MGTKALSMLQAGDRIALICPCGPPHLDKSREGMKILRSWGLEPVPGPLFSTYLEGKALPLDLSFLAGSDESRWHELEWALGGSCAATWVVRGGYGLTRLLPRLHDHFPARPLFGFSDVSVLLFALQSRGWGELVHCANVQTLPSLTPAALEATRRLVLHSDQGSLKGSIVRTGSATGELWGGNLCVLASLCGTPEAARAGPRILCLEDVNEAPYRIDRLLTQLWESGGLRGLLGVALGRFSGCGELELLWRHWAERWQVPVLADLPFGHTSDNFPLWLGKQVRIEGDQICWASSSMRRGSGAATDSSSEVGV